MKIFLDDERDTPSGWVRAYWPDEVIHLLKTEQVTELSLDHDLGDDNRGTGYDVVLWIEEAVITRGFNPPNIRVHSANSSARQKMEQGIKSIYQRAKIMIPKEVEKEIQQRLDVAEMDHGVKVLYAVESGSRAWGFASPNSDYDIRFIYVHPKDWYIAVDLEEKRDVIEYPIYDEIDISGWDIRKALRLFKKSNPSFVEWLLSPIVYRDDGMFAGTARDILDSEYSIEKGIYHYRSMAKTNYRGYLRKDEVPLKKYFYVLRPLLSIMWLEKYREPAPIEFAKLRQMVAKDKTLDEAITHLLERKKVALEKEVAPAIPVLNDFIQSELERLESYNETTEKGISNYSALNQLFHRTLRNQ